MFEWRSVFDLHGYSPDADVDPQRVEMAHHFTGKVRYRARGQLKRLPRPLTGLDLQFMVDEIEVNLEDEVSIGDGRGGEATRGHVERDLPAVRNRRSKSKPDLAYNLHPTVQGDAGLLPVIQGQGRPHLRSSESNDCCTHRPLRIGVKVGLTNYSS